MPPSCQDGDRAGWHHTIARFTPISIAGNSLVSDAEAGQERGRVPVAARRTLRHRLLDLGEVVRGEGRRQTQRTWSSRSSAINSRCCADRWPGPRYTPPDRIILAALARLLPRGRWPIFLSAPSTLPCGAVPTRRPSANRSVSPAATSRTCEPCSGKQPDQHAPNPQYQPQSASSQRARRVGTRQDLLLVEQAKI